MATDHPASRRNVLKFRKLARILADHYLPGKTGQLRFLSGGLSNFVFRVKSGKGEFVIRISPDLASIESFIKEQWVQQEARKAEVPSAEILEVGIEIIQFPYMISKSIEGTVATRHPDKNAILKQMGKLAARINSIRTKGFGETFDWSQNKLSRRYNWKEYLETEYRYEERLDVLEKNSILGRAGARRIRSIMGDACSVNARPSLCHGDLRMKNVLIRKSGEIAAIVDWEKATSNIAPDWELSLALHDLGIDEAEAFIQGYGIGPKKFREHSPLIKAFNILNYVPEVERLLKSKDRAALARISLRVSGAFDLFSP